MSYEFLIASLPVLTFGEAPVLSCEEFDALIREHLPKAEAAKVLADGSDSAVKLLPVCAVISEFEDALKYAVAKKRAEKLGVTFNAAGKEYPVLTETDNLVANAALAPNPVERERCLDRARWQLLDDNELYHDFDLTHLYLYRAKLLIAEKYRGRDSGKGRRKFEIAAEDIVNNKN